MKIKYMTTAACAIVAFLGISMNASAVPITGLFSTGVDASGVALPANSFDSNYEILGLNQQAVTIQDLIPGSWVPNSATARWVWQSADGQPTGTVANPVVRTFRTTFDLTGLDVATANITGQWASDNFGGDILINGTIVAGSASFGFGSLTSFTISSGFVAGINTLDFLVGDVGGIAGFLVSSLQGTADLDDASVPEPATLGLLGLGLLGLGVSRRRQVI